MQSTRLLSRRAALGKLSAGSLLALGLWPGTLAAADRGRGGDFRFIVVSDTHCTSPECGPWLEGAVRQMKSLQPELVLHAGDLTDLAKPEHFATMKEVFGKLDVPWYPVIGNHDYASQTDRSAYDKCFPNRLNYAFRHRGWQFIALDSSEGQRYEGTTIGDETFRFVEKLEPGLDRTCPTILLTHFPLGPGVNYRPERSDELLDVFRDCNLQAVFCGHWHAQTRRDLGNYFLATGRCCALRRGNHDGSKEKGFLVCEAQDGRVFWQFVEYAGQGRGQA